MHAINKFILEYIFFPTAVIAYVVAMWSFIVWMIRFWIKKGAEKQAAQNKQEGDGK